MLEGDACRLVALPQGGHQTSHRAAYVCFKETRADMLRCKEGAGVVCRHEQCLQAAPTPP